MLTFTTRTASVFSRKSKRHLLYILIAFASMHTLNSDSYAATPGLPFVEDFADTNLRDTAKTNADWSTDEQALLLAWRVAKYGALGPTTTTASSISAETGITVAIAVGDMDGDGDLDVVAGNNNQPNRLYLNNGTSEPFNGVTGSDITSDSHASWSVKLGDVDNDGDLDVVVGNWNQANRLYLNNGTADPFAGVIGSNISTISYDHIEIAITVHIT